MEINPCPFCGTTEDEGYLKVINIAPPNVGIYFAVHCDNCGVSGTPISLIFNTGSDYEEDKKEAKKTAVEYWNARKE